MRRAAESCESRPVRPATPSLTLGRVGSGGLQASRDSLSLVALGTNPTLSANLRSFVFNNLVGAVGSARAPPANFRPDFRLIAHVEAGPFQPRGCSRQPLNSHL